MSRQEVICISGCSSGIGRALAERLAGQGAIVYAGVRDLAGAGQFTRARPLELDVTHLDQISAAIDRIERECGSLDVLINNAGVNAIGPWELVPDEVIGRVFDVNFFGAVNLTKAVLPLMRRQRSGQIVMVSSLSAQIALPLGGVYAASKAALEAFAESLSYEVRAWNIRVAVMNPGGYASGLDSKAWRPATGSLGDYSPLEPYVRAQSGASAGGSEEAAARIIAAMHEGSERLRHPLDDTGRWVFRTLRLDSESDRDRVVRTASGLEWWFEPKE